MPEAKKQKPSYAIAGDLIIIKPEPKKSFWSIKEVPKKGGTDFDHVCIVENRKAAEKRAAELAKVTGARVFIRTNTGNLIPVVTSNAQEVGFL